MSKELLWRIEEHTPGRFTITDGRISFEIHKLIDGSMRKDKYPDGIIVSEDQAREYADEIWSALNTCMVMLEEDQ